MLSSVWHAILDNFRPISIWATQLAIFSLTDGAHGEAWTRASYAQLVGLVVMLLGTVRPAILDGSGWGEQLLCVGCAPSASRALARDD